MNTTLYMVTGAPGSGKTTALSALLRRASPYLAFDIDWLTIAASRLARSDIIIDRTTWPAYNALWFEVLGAVYRNGKAAIFFSPLDLNDMAHYGRPAWCERIAWLLLDCGDGARQARLRARPGWDADMIAEALSDAQVLRQQIPDFIDTGVRGPDEVAEAIMSWIEGLQ